MVRVVKPAIGMATEASTAGSDRADQPLPDSNDDEQKATDTLCLDAQRLRMRIHLAHKRLT
jgi:hypothetical protein